MGWDALLGSNRRPSGSRIDTLPLPPRARRNYSLTWARTKGQRVKNPLRYLRYRGMKLMAYHSPHSRTRCSRFFDFGRAHA